MFPSLTKSGSFLPNWQTFGCTHCSKKIRLDVLTLSLADFIQYEPQHSPLEPTSNNMYVALPCPFCAARRDSRGELYSYNSCKHGRLLSGEASRDAFHFCQEIALFSYSIIQKTIHRCRCFYNWFLADIETMHYTCPTCPSDT